MQQFFERRRFELESVRGMSGPARKEKSPNVRNSDGSANTSLLSQVRTLSSSELVLSYSKLSVDHRSSQRLQPVVHLQALPLGWPPRETEQALEAPS